jgi:hypothetical protein
MAGVLGLMRRQAYRDEARHEQLAILGATLGFLALIVGSLVLLCHIA